MSQSHNPNLLRGDGQLTDVPRGTHVVHAVAMAPLPSLQVAPGIAIIPLLQLQVDMEPFETNVVDIEGQVSRAEIGNQERYQAGSDILSSIQSQLSQIEAKRVEAKKPADDYGGMVQKLTVPLKDRLTAAKTTLTNKMLTWKNAEEARLKAAQDAIRKQQEEEAAKLAAAAREQGNEKTAVAIEEMVAAAPPAPVPKVSHANYAGKTHGTRTYWLGDMQDPMEILRNVVAGKLPLHVVEFSKSGMNAEAEKFIKALPEADQKEQVYLGIKITKSQKLV